MRSLVHLCKDIKNGRALGFAVEALLNLSLDEKSRVQIVQVSF